MSSMKGFQDTIAWYDKHAKEFAQKAGSAVYDTLAQFTKLLPKGGKVLDAGCGSGRDTMLFLQGGFDATGIDLSSGLIEEAKKENPECKFLVGDMRHLPFPNNDFDGVWASASLLHFETRQDVEKSIQEFNRVLKKHGILYVSVKLQTGKEKTGLEEDKRFTEPRFFQYFTQDEIHELIKDGGFTISISTIEQSRSRADIKWVQIIAKKS